MYLNLANLPYPGKRQPLFATHGVVATSQPLAAQAGLTMLQQGGNAVDAALAAAIALTVVEPTSCDIGGDAFAMVWDGATLHGLNGSGRAPAALTIEEMHKRGYEKIPATGWPAVTVPGAPAAWRDLHQRFGRLPFARLFEPAITYAEHGYPVTPTMLLDWHKAVDNVHSQLEGDAYSGFAPVFTPSGHSPQIGEIWRNPDSARTLRQIADSNAEAFYHGDIARAIADFAARTDGFISVDDLAQHTSTWVTPISTSYRSYDVWELPPNGQGLTALIALNILEGFDLASLPRESTQSYHLQLEALKLAFADAQRYIADPEQVTVPTTELLSKQYAARRRALIGEQALMPEPGDPMNSGTVYLCAADSDGMMVSFIQSIFSTFGSHVVVPGLGFSLQNRGRSFSLDLNHPNHLMPGKRPFHTIIPAFLTRHGKAIGPFGVMGGHMQPQGHVQMVVNTIDHGLNPQASLDAPRWYWAQQRDILVEPGVDAAIVQALRQKEHAIAIEPHIDIFGHGQIIWRLPSGAYVVGSDGRSDGGAVGY